MLTCPPGQRCRPSRISWSLRTVLRGIAGRTHSVDAHMGIDWICIFLAVIGCWTSRSEIVLFKSSNKKAIPTATKADELMGRVSARLVRFSRLMNRRWEERVIPFRCNGGGYIRMWWSARFNALRSASDVCKHRLQAADVTSLGNDEAAFAEQAPYLH